MNLKPTEIDDLYSSQCGRCLLWAKDATPHVCEPPVFCNDYAPETDPYFDELIIQNERHWQRAKWVVAGMIIVYIAAYLYSIWN